MADFSRLPYNLSCGATINITTPNLAEGAFNPRLGRASGINGNVLSLPQGLHLHWALPDALVTGRHRDGSTQFPAVPNRWLVRRLNKEGQLQKSWIVESDFLHPCNATTRQPEWIPPVDGQGKPITSWPEGKPVTFPTKRIQLPDGEPGAAFRYMGRSVLLSDWLQRKDIASDDYLNQPINSRYKLTALGYGEPAFGAYYPNCYSVFGFCDIDPDINVKASYEYQVIGWFNEVDLDPLQSEEFSHLPDDAHRYAALCKEYRWCLPKDETTKPFPGRTICYCSLTLMPDQVTPWSSEGKVDIALGNAGGEALAALLADEVAKEQTSEKEVIEYQLEALNLAAVLQGVTVDYPAHFAQSRHQRGFRGINGGNRWAVLPKYKQPVSAAHANLSAEPKPPLPDAVAHALDALNTAQESYDLAWQEIVELRYQTFCDWHKFLSAYYSDAVGLQPFHEDSDALRDFIENQSLKLLNGKIDLAGTLVSKNTRWEANGLTAVTLDLRTNTLTPENATNATLATQVILRLKTLIDTLITARLTDHFEIATRPAEHFWRPREPVVLLSGPVAISTARHGEDGDLNCALLTVADAPGTPAFFDAIGELKPAAGDPSIQIQSASPWHPIILEWSVSVQTVSAYRKPNPAIEDTLDYEPTFLIGSFELQENEPDFSPPGPLPLLDRDTYEGRCVMTATASTQLDVNLRTFLKKATLYDCRDRAALSEKGYLDRLIA
jgi:hypothetical protein